MAHNTTKHIGFAEKLCLCVCKYDNLYTPYHTSSQIYTLHTADVLPIAARVIKIFMTLAPIRWIIFHSILLLSSLLSGWCVSSRSMLSSFECLCFSFFASCVCRTNITLITDYRKSLTPFNVTLIHHNSSNAIWFYEPVTLISRPPESLNAIWNIFFSFCFEIKIPTIHTCNALWAQTEKWTQLKCTQFQPS